MAAPNWMPEVDYQKMMSVLVEVGQERKNQDGKWGQQNRPLAQYAIVLHEEVGEVSKAICEAEFAPGPNYRHAQIEQARAELIQVAAVAVAMIECLDPNELKPL